MLEATGPSICAIHLPDDFQLSPRLALTVESDGHWTSAPLEDMYPPISRDELRRNMIVPTTPPSNS
jgi:acetolactate synthase I/II/III large subunit